jgi:molecular chaperone GrpE
VSEQANGNNQAGDQKSADQAPAVETPADETVELRKQVEENKNRWLRTQAELENFRKRVARQMEEEQRYASVPLLRDLLPVWDNTLRAVEAAEKAPEAAKVVEGFRMVAGQLERVLQQHNCQRIDALFKPFDPHRHEAITQQPSADYPANTVIFVVRDGFQVHDRVIRPSQVIVSTAVPGAAQAAADEAFRQQGN